MKLHPNGTLEGTPEELSAYMKLNKTDPVKLCNWPPFVPAQGKSQAADALRRLDERYPGAGNGPYTTSAPSQAHYR